MPFVRDHAVHVDHITMFSQNESRFVINFETTNDFKATINAMKKHTKMAIKEALFNVIIDFGEYSDMKGNGSREIKDYKRFMIEKSAVVEMIFNKNTESYEIVEKYNFDATYKSVNFIFDTIGNEINHLKKKHKEK